MGFIANKTGKANGGFIAGRLGKVSSGPATDLSTLEGLLYTAQSAGYGGLAERVVSKTKKPSLLQRLSDILSRGTYASAGLAKAIVKNEKDPLAEAWKGFTGKEKETYSDVLDAVGVKNKYAKAIGGLAGDIFLDPLTYLGTPIIKGGLKIIGKALKGTVNVAGKVPIAKNVVNTGRMAAEPLKDALGRAFVYGYKTTEGLSDDATRAINSLSKAKAGIAESAIGRYKSLSKTAEKNLFKILVETRKEELAARKLGEAGVDFGAKILEKARLAGASDDTLKLIGGQLARNKKFAKLAGVAQPYEAYFPFLKSDNLKNVEQATRRLRVGSEGYLKQFQAKLKPEDIINSIPEAFARREFQIVRDKITRDSLTTIVKKYGKQFASSDDAIREGFRAVKEKGQFGKIVGYLQDADARFIDNLFNAEFTTIDKLAKATGFDAFNRLWKTSVTKYFPAFHARNWASGVTQNYQVLGADALNPVIHKVANKVMKGTVKTVKLGGKLYNADDLLRQYTSKFGSGDWKHIADIGDAIADGRKPLSLASYAKGNLAKLDYGSKMGEWVETQQKMVAYLASLNQKKGIKEALKIAERAGFDYAKVTPFEVKIMRRLIPFYSFTRKNLELQARTLITNPERSSNILKALRNAGVATSGGQATDEELAGLPDFVKEGLNIRTGKFDKYGRPMYMTTGGTALESAIQQFSGNIPLKLVSQSNPILKYVFERATGIDAFRSSSGEIVRTSDVKNADAYSNAPKILKNWLGMKEVKKAQYVEGKKVGERIGYEADPKKLSILNALPTSRFVSTASGLLGKEMSSGEKTLKFLTGIRQYPVDIEQQGYFKNKKAREELTKLLEELGVIKTFERPYIPKSK
jgi:hypothetical protein